MVDRSSPASATVMLPCPFCGDTPSLRTRMDEDIWTHNIVEWIGVGCSECGIEFEQPVTSDDKPSDLWNRRALPDEAATTREPVAWQFRQRSAVGKGPQSSLPWCDWCSIEREDYDLYVRHPNELVQVRPLYADDAQGWRDIGTAPKDGTRFWAFERREGYQQYECWWQEDFGHWQGWQTDWDNEPQPTHWRPLLAGPPITSTTREAGK